MMVAASMWEWTRSHPWRAISWLVLVVLAAASLRVCAAEARLDRNWVEHLAHMPEVALTGAGFTLDPVMDWTYTAEGPREKAWTDFKASYSALRNVWFVVEPQPGGDYAAHTLVLFEFADDRIVGATVEARLEATETYSPVDGAFNRYELAYVWATARDLLVRRATFLDKDVFVYPLQLEDKQKQDFLKALLGGTIAVATRPRFYNTFTSNCTNELAKVAGIGWHYSWVLTGYSPQYLFGEKLIPGTSFEAVKANALLSDQIRSWGDFDIAEFDRALLAELRARW